MLIGTEERMKKCSLMFFCALILIMVSGAESWAKTKPSRKIPAERAEFLDKSYVRTWSGVTENGGFDPYAVNPNPQAPSSREELEAEKREAMKERERLHAEWAISKTPAVPSQEEHQSNSERSEVESRELPTRDNFAELELGQEEERYSPRPDLLPERSGDEIPRVGSRGVVFASWYGEDFHGDTMANGEPFNMFAFTVAQKTWPAGTIANYRVVNTDYWVKNVPKTDWGPNEASRDIDVSYQLAAELGFVKEGTAWLEYEIVYVPPLRNKR